VRATLELAADDEGKAGAIEKTRTLTNAWVARYRRDKVITGGAAQLLNPVEPIA
jgi:photosystem II Psb27 protein